MISFRDGGRNTLTQMRMGGVYDHIGFGFHRYSTDNEWLLPHFEKMLYDQALISMALVETYQATHKEEYKLYAEEIFEYVLRDMTAPEGGFYSAEDADSEGEEGKFYVWTIEEIRNVLSDDAKLFIKLFNIDDGGNLPAGEAGWTDESKAIMTETNILHLKNSIDNLKETDEFKHIDLIEFITRTRRKLFDEREKRIHPHKDDKILTDWNGLMISAFLQGGGSF